MTTKHSSQGILLMILSCACFTAAWIGIKFLTPRLPLIEIIFFRGFISLICLIPLVYRRVGSFSASNYGSLFYRSSFGVAAMFLHFYALKNIDIGNAAALVNTAPIFVAILSPFILGERFRRQSFFLIVMAFIGACFILKPNSHVISTGALSALGGGFFAALAMIYIRKLHGSDSSTTIAFYFTLMATLSGLPMIMHFVWPTPLEWGVLLGTGMIITAAQLAMTKAYAHGEASLIAPFNYVSVIFSYAVGMIFWKDIPDRWSLLGAAVIVASGVGIMLAGKKAKTFQLE
ncbi:MAG: DMT family transporter [Deltaproteobacteria bacterium]|nr:DMT family transporter [Deltaproteobacteria bacterium]